MGGSDVLTGKARFAKRKQPHQKKNVLKNGISLHQAENVDHGAITASSPGAAHHAPGTGDQPGHRQKNGVFENAGNLKLSPVFAHIQKREKAVQGQDQRIRQKKTG